MLRGPVRTDVENPLPEWLPNTAWFCVQKLIEIDFFSTFAGNLEKDAPNRFKEWFNEINPEDAKLPLDWKKLDQMPFQKLLVLRFLRYLQGVGQELRREYGGTGYCSATSSKCVCTLPGEREVG